MLSEFSKMMSLSTMMILMSCSVGFYHHNFLFFLWIYLFRIIQLCFSLQYWLVYIPKVFRWLLFIFLAGYQNVSVNSYNRTYTLSIAILESYQTNKKPSGSSTPYTNKGGYNASNQTPIMALNVDDFDEDSFWYFHERDDVRTYHYWFGVAVK